MSRQRAEPDQSQWTAPERVYYAWLVAAEAVHGPSELVLRAQQMVRSSRAIRGGLSGAEFEAWNLAARKASSGDRSRSWTQWRARPRGQGPARPSVPASPVREGLIAVIGQVVPVPPASVVELGWGEVSFEEVVQALLGQAQDRQVGGGAIAQQEARELRSVTLESLCRVPPARADQLDPVLLGLGSWAFGSAVPPYVPREVDDALAEQLRAAGAPVVVRGPAASGKSRSVLEQLRLCRPAAQVWWVNSAPGVLPAVREELRRRRDRVDAAGVVVVLDDAHLCGVDPLRGLNQAAVSWVAARVTLVVVLHEDRLASWARSAQQHGLDDGVGATTALLRLLTVDPIDFRSELSDGEAIAAEPMYRAADPGVRGLDRRRLGEVLSAVDRLEADARAAQRSSVPGQFDGALVDAAIDAAVAFPDGAEPEELAVLTRANFVRRAPNAPWSEVGYQAALERLSTGLSIGSSSSLLIRGVQDRLRLLDAVTPRLLQPGRGFDHLVAAPLPGEAFTNIGVWLWGAEPDEAVKQGGAFARGGLHVDAPSTAWFKRGAARHHPTAWVALGVQALQREDVYRARQLWLKAWRAGELSAAHNLGVLARDLEGPAAAEAWFLRSAEAGDVRGMVSVAEVAETQGRTALRRHWLEQAARAGDVDGMWRLGMLLRDEGDLVGARRWLLRAAESGHEMSAAAMNSLALLEQAADDAPLAVALLHRAATLGNPEAMNNLGRHMAASGSLDAAMRWWRAADEAGDAEAAFNLSLELTDPVQARSALERSAERGAQPAMNNLGLMLIEDGELTAGTDWLERAAALGNVTAALNRALTAVPGERPDNRRYWLQVAADGGHPDGMLELAIHLDRTLSSPASLQWLKAAADAGHPRARGLIGERAFSLGDWAEAEGWWRQAAEDGDAAALTGLARVALEQDDEAAARRLLRRADKAGDPDAATLLGQLARPESAERAGFWWRRAARAGDAEAANELGHLALESGDEAQARRWWLMAAEAGHPDAMFHYGRMIREEQPEQARDWFESAAALGSPDAMSAAADYRWDEDQAAAVEQYRRAGEAGSMRGLVQYGNALAEHGDRDAARRQWQIAAEAGDEDACLALGTDAVRSGDDETAQRWWQAAADAGSAAGLNNLGVRARLSGDLEAARRLLRAAIAEGSTVALTNLAGLELDVPGREARGAALARQALRASDPRGDYLLGHHALEHGDRGEALTRILRAARAGDADAMYVLADRLQQPSDPGEAEWLQRAADAGQGDALHDVARRRQADGDDGVAQELLRQAAAAGSVAAVLDLGRAAQAAGELTEARRRFSHAAALGSSVALVQLAVPALCADREESRRLLTVAADRGWAPAMLELAKLAQDDGDGAGMRSFIERAAAAGSVWGMCLLGQLQLGEGDRVSAGASLLAASRAGEVQATMLLGLLAFDRGDEAEAQRWYSAAFVDGVPAALEQWLVVATHARAWHLQAGVLREAAAAGSVEAQLALAVSAAYRGALREAAELCLQAAVQRPSALAMLGVGFNEVWWRRRVRWQWLRWGWLFDRQRWRLLMRVQRTVPREGDALEGFEPPVEGGVADTGRAYRRLNEFWMARAVRVSTPSPDVAKGDASVDASPSMQVTGAS